MEAFKAANPGACLEDFVRWHSPRDWIAQEGETSGVLSQRMQESGNLWRELWQSAKPVPAMKQKPLFNSPLEGEKVLHMLDNWSLLDFLKQFVASL